MKQLFIFFNKRYRQLFLAILFFLSHHLYSESWPTAVEQAKEMIIGWNIGNTLEVPLNYGGETGWGNPKVTQQLIDSLKKAGFNVIRIPCAWDSYADNQTFEIKDWWLERVKEVVDYCLNNDMFVIINSHWDGGWLEENPTYAMQDKVNEKHEAYWTQIANLFSEYDERLLFAGTNEVRENYGTPSQENIIVQQSYNQTFVDAVRATQGNNLKRNLIVQTYNTNIGHGLNFFSLPDDVVEERLMIEIHYYDPYDFSLNEGQGASTLWGKPFEGDDVCNWGQESYVDGVFRQVKEKWVDNGIPVINGEYGVIHRKSLTGEDYEKHLIARQYWLEYVTKVAIENGIIPFYWDNGWNGNNGFALFDRNTGEVVDRGALDALMKGAGVGDWIETYYISKSVRGQGSISIEPEKYFYEEGTEVTITAIDEHGWEFFNWSGDLSGSTNPTVVLVDENKSITANFFESYNNVNTPDKSMNIYPNPVTNGRITVELYGVQGESSVRLLDLRGRILKEMRTVDAYPFFFDFDAKTGLYLLHIVNNDKTLTKKISVR